MTSIRRSTTGALLALSLVAAGAPAATASPVSPSYPSSQAGAPQQPAVAGVYDRADKTIIGTTTSSAAGTISPQPVVRIQMAKGGFDWADAGIGAAGGLALAMVGLGGALGVAQHRTRRTRSRSVPSV